MNNSAIIIFGAAGDLTKRKLIPAVYDLVAKKKIENFVLIGAAWNDITAQQMLDGAKEFITNVDQEVWDTLVARTSYQKLDFDKLDDYKKLNLHIFAKEQHYNLSGDRLIYFAAASRFYCTLTDNIAASGIAARKDEHQMPWHRIVYEKPFGHNLQSAKDINRCIAKSFNESQIYRVDHYLTKELVSNIELVRFTNCVFEPLWNNRFIDQIQIVLSETLGVEGRGGYYDKYGALCDVVQNHMLELLALTAMEAPEKLTGDYVPTERAKVLKKVRFVDGILGQYDGYRSEPDVASDSHTDTYAMLFLHVDNPRWAGVPFYLKTGKALDKHETVIHIKFKQVDCLLARNCPSDTNWLTFKVSPEAAFSLFLNAKKPGRSDELMQVAMEFCHSCLFGAQTPQAYEVIIEEVMRGEQSISVRFDEIEYAWKTVDTIKERKLPLYFYEPGSTGPKETQEFSKKHGIRWRS